MKIIKTTDARNQGIDYLKAMAITFVLLWHLQPLRTSLPGYLHSLTTLFYYQVSLIGVPVFFIISLYLFYNKVDFIYFKYRIWRLVSIFIFWSIIQYCVYALIMVINNKPFTISLSLSSVIQLLIMGGPTLPIVGEPVFYFIFDLIILSILAYGFMKLTANARNVVGIIIIIISLIYYEVCLVYSKDIPYWRIDNYVVYIPVAYFIKNINKLSKYKYVLLLLYIVCTIQELIIIKHHHYMNINVYGLNSIVLGAIVITTIVMSLNITNINYLISFLAIYSLGIFAIHKYWQLLVTVSMDKILSLSHIGIYGQYYIRQIDVNKLLIALFTISFTLISVYICNFTIIKRYIR